MSFFNEVRSNIRDARAIMEVLDQAELRKFWFSHFNTQVRKLITVEDMTLAVICAMERCHEQFKSCCWT